MSPWAVRYNGKSILENHHAATTWQVAIDPPTCITEHMDKEQKRIFRKSLIESILATDMVHHGKVTAQLKQLDPAEPFTKGNPDHKELLMKLCLHSADLSNPLARTFETAKRWALSVCLEFDTQAKKERAVGLTPAPFMVITSMQAVAKLQCTFCDFVIKPYFSALAVVFSELNEQLEWMAAHRQKWQQLADDDANADVQFPPPSGLSKCGSHATATSMFASALSTHHEVNVDDSPRSISEPLSEPLNNGGAQ